MSYTPNNAWNNSPQTGLSSNPGPFLAEVMKNDDPLYSGRLLVYIPDFGGDPEQESSWLLVRYMSPYYGIQPLSNRLAADPAAPESLESYGMWMTPPDLGVKVLVMFINGDRSKGVWMGCLPEIGSHGAIPGNDKGDFDVFTNQSAANNDIKSIPRPEHSTAPTFDTQGLTNDLKRGKPITTSSLRESPTKVFGMNTPSGHSFFMDDGAEDGTNKMVRLRTAAGNMVMMNDDDGFVYMINAQGTSWVSMSPQGSIDIYGEEGISMATKGSIQMHADIDIKMHANRDIKIVAENISKLQGNKETDIYGGSLKLSGAEKVNIHTCGTMYSTANKGFFFKANAQFILEGSCFKWNSGSAQVAEQVVPETPKDVHGYKSTVERAPNHEPWPGHDEPAGTTQEPSGVVAQSAAAGVGGFGGAGDAINTATDSLEAFGGAGSPVIGLDAFGGAGDAINTATDSLEAFGGAGSPVIGLDAFGGAGDAINTATDSLEAFGGAGSITNSTVAAPTVTPPLQTRPTDNELTNSTSTAPLLSTRPLARPIAQPSNNIVTNGLMTIRAGGQDFNNAINTVFDSAIDLSSIKDITLSNPLTSLKGLDSALSLTGASGLTGALGEANNLLNTLQNPLSAIRPNITNALSGGISAIQNVIGGDVADAIGNIGGTIGGVVGDIGGTIGGVVGDIGGTIGGVVGDIGGGTIGGITDNIVGEFDTLAAGDALKNIGDMNVSSALPAVPNASKGKSTAQGENCATGKTGDEVAQTGSGAIPGGFTPNQVATATGPDGIPGTNDDRPLPELPTAVPSKGMTPEKANAIREFSQQYGVNPNAVAGILSIESNLDPSIQGGFGDRYFGIFQLQDTQIPGLTQRVLGRSLTPEQYITTSFSDQLKVYGQYISDNIRPGFFTGDASQDAARLWTLQLAPSRALTTDYNDPNAVISRTNQAAAISAAPGLVTVGSVVNATIERGGLA